VVRVKRRVKTLLRRGWRAVHRLAPALAERVDDRRRARLRSASAVAGVVHFEERIASLERDLDLLSKQVAVLTMRVERPSADGRDARADEDERVVTARLGAIAFYEERISRLEAAVGVAGDPAADGPPAMPK
jgi:hypothetical protein